MKRARLAALACCLAAACSSTPDPSSLRNELITPGEAIGLVYLGMPLADLYKLKGQPRETRNQKNTTTYVYNDVMAMVDTHANKQVVLSMATTDANYATKDLLKVTSPDIRIRSILGKPACETESAQGRSLHYEGIRFLVLKGQVTQISVHKGDLCP